MSFLRFCRLTLVPLPHLAAMPPPLCPLPPKKVWWRVFPALLPPDAGAPASPCYNATSLVPPPKRFGGVSFLRFRRLTLVPIQTKMIEPSLMKPEEIKWLDDYHQEVGGGGERIHFLVIHEYVMIRWMYVAVLGTHTPPLPNPSPGKVWNAVSPRQAKQAYASFPQAPLSPRLPPPTPPK